MIGGDAMPGRIKDMTFPDGETRKIEELDFEIIREEWNEYQLAHGAASLKVKTVVVKVFWVLDSSGARMYNPEGDPFLIVRSNNQVVASE